jgi:hypothetical protein
MSILRTLLSNCNVLYNIGSHILPLVKIPESIKQNFQGLSISKEFFKIGERSRAVSWLKSWLQNNANGHVTICDPYFEEDQMWILQSISADISVRIICLGDKLLGSKLNSKDSSEIKKGYKNTAKKSNYTAHGATKLGK